MKSEFLPFVKSPLAIFPLNRAIGSVNVMTESLSTDEHNVGYDSLWVPTHQLGSPMFSKHFNHDSFITLDLDGEMTSIEEFTILMWVKPTQTKLGVALVTL